MSTEEIKLKSKVRSSVFITPFLLEAPDGTSIDAEWGRLPVPENHAKPDGNMIEIPFVRLKSSAKKPGTPIMFLGGGPGISYLSKIKKIFPSSLGSGPFPFSLFSFINFPEIADFIGDIIIVEQRGVGHSRPRLGCPGTFDMPLDRPISREALISAARKYFKNCVGFWKGHHVDLSSYNTREMASDIDLLRQALDYNKISLFGYSFGSQHGIAMLKYYSEHIEKAVLMSVESLDQTIKLPSQIQNTLQKLSDLISTDLELTRRIPDFLELVRTVLNRLEQEPVTVEVPDPDTGEKVVITLGKFDLQLATANCLATTHLLRALPARYYAMSKGNFTWLAERALKFRRHRNVNMMNLAVDCANGASTERLARIEHEAKQTLLGGYVIEMAKYELCDILGDIDLGDSYRNNVKSEVPVLLIGGNLDARTTINNINEAINGGLVNGQLLVVEGVAHDFYAGGPYVVEKIFQAISRFLKGEPQSTTVIKAPFKFDPLN
jgi:pimeloyl-ACP methyl ester carboxylesterase